MKTFPPALSGLLSFSLFIYVMYTYISFSCSIYLYFTCAAVFILRIHLYVYVYIYIVWYVVFYRENCMHVVTCLLPFRLMEWSAHAMSASILPRRLMPSSQRIQGGGSLCSFGFTSFMYPHLHLRPTLTSSGWVRLTLF